MACGRDRGSVALEAALALPSMLLMVIGLYDATCVLTAWSRMALAADAVTQIATNFLVDPANGDPFVLRDASARKATDAVFAYLPDWRRLQPGGFSITLTSVRSNGGAANTIWSYSSDHGRQDRRPCGALDAGDGGSMNQVPAFLVADVALTYRPMFLKFFTGGFDFRTTSYLPARSFTTNQKIDFDTPSDRNLTYCGGS